MSKILNVLIVENNETDILSYLDVIKTINREQFGEFEIKPVIKETKEGGLEALDDNSWSAAFIDLKLSTGDILNSDEGNEIIREIYHKKRFPIYVLTNTPGEVSYEFKESLFLKIASKTDVDYHEVFCEVIKIYKTGIINIIGRTGLIEKMLDEIFWNNISQTIEEWFLEINTEKQLLRFTISNLQEYLELSEAGDFDVYFPTETYIRPFNIKKFPFTGDIIKQKNDDSYWIVLTPACDLATDSSRQKPKAKHITISKIYPFEKIYNGRTEEQIIKLKVNNLDLKYHYLPQSMLFTGGFINFQEIQSIPLSTFLDGESISYLCVVAQSFRKDIISRFSNYFARQGQPSFST